VITLLVISCNCASNGCWVIICDKSLLINQIYGVGFADKVGSWSSVLVCIKETRRKILVSMTKMSDAL
jgi:hypothetical protein